MEATIQVNARDYEKLLRRLAGDAARRAMLRGVVSGAARCIPIVHRSTREAPPANPAGKGSGGAFSSGEYLRAWRSEVIPNGARVRNDRPYAAVVELGRRPGATGPPVDPDVIAHWAQRRLGLTAREAKGVSFVIRRAIKKRGLLPRQVLGRALPEMSRAVAAEIESELRKAAL